MRTRRSAFTLVELLVVITIIGMMMALLLPAIGMVREAARQTNCTSNQQNVAKAILNYTTSRDRLPPSMSIGFGASPDMTNPVARARVWGWVPPLLKELNYAAQYDKMTEVIGNLATNDYELLFANFYARELSCPSHTRETIDQPWISYYVNGGRANRADSSIANSLYGFGNAPPNPMQPDWKENGAMDIRLPTPNGATIIEANTIDGISRGDGTSLTILLTENTSPRDFDLDGSPPYLGNTWSNTYVDGTGNIAIAPPVEFHNAVFWQAGSSGGNPAPIPNEFVSNPLFPNESEIVLVNQHPEDPLDRAHARPASYHPGVVIVTFCDGHTQKIAETVDYAVYAAIMSSNGRKVQQPGSNPPNNNDAPWQAQVTVSEAALAP